MSNPTSNPTQSAELAAARVDPSPRRSRRRRWALAVPAAIALGALAWYVIARIGVESTDDSFIDGNVYRVGFEIAGRIASVHVADNQVVEKGQLLAELDPAVQRAGVERARAALELARARCREADVEIALTEATTAAAVTRARADLAAAQARFEQQNAELASSRAEASRAEADLERYEKLSERAVSPERLDRVRQEATTAQAALVAVEKRVASAHADTEAAEADVKTAEADRERVAAARAAAERHSAEANQAAAALREAELQLSYTQVVAPAAGRVTKKAALAGTYVGAGQTVMSIVSPDVWVTANFKETQLTHIRPGQVVSVRVDAYGIVLHGHVDSVQSGTGSRFSLLPPENATGNWVKVVQRVPVKIVLDDLPHSESYVLGPGMSVVTVVRTQ